MKLFSDSNVPLATSDQTAQVHWLNKVTYADTPQGLLRHLHLKRASHVVGAAWTLKARTKAENEYHKYLEHFASQYRTWAGQNLPDLVVAPPSTSNDALPYRDAVKDGAVQVMDLTNCFSKDPAVTSKSSDLTVEQLIDAITFVYEGDLSSYRKVAIVDDVLASGKTASAMLHHLYAAGLSKEAVVHVCAPLWINK